MTWEPTLDDYRWLVSRAAETWLAEAMNAESPIPARFVGRLRRELSAVRTSLVVGQAELRRRALPRFRAAERMFFTGKSLEQATDDRIAQYKATEVAASYGANQRGVDLCCGIGGDLTQLALRCPMTGIELDPTVVVLAKANLQALEANAGQVNFADVCDIDVAEFNWWHIDPDRRSWDRRTSRAEASQPGPQEIDQLLESNPDGSIKLAPAAKAPTNWEEAAELEWIGHSRQCQQQWARFGQLARCPGERTATTLNEHGEVLFSFSGSANVSLDRADSIEGFLYEPPPSVIAARLTAALAEELGLRPVQPGIAYLTTDQELRRPGLDRFRVLDCLPFDAKRVKMELRARSVGVVEVKKRGVDVEPSLLQKRWRGQGDCSATVLIFPHGCQTMAVIAERAVD